MTTAQVAPGMRQIKAENVSLQIVNEHFECRTGGFQGAE
jgi:hypothetical protein